MRIITTTAAICRLIRESIAWLQTQPASVDRDLVIWLLRQYERALANEDDDG